ncbi:hypothetical protein TSUD_313050 [Trifolium subterraneum]|uniref:Uncharacterized protein n=1 Tax=Trifolium subterraneum TaxID=3900 RepID=A0A2Z6M7D2_TRISU|nr:hypothetical protein TSUD_313050 [Trifolium subterraneum]
MGSGDDMHDANDIESLDDDFYSGGTEDDPMDNYSDYDDDAAEDDSDPAESRRTEQSFTILKESDIRQRQEDDITFVGIATKRLTVRWIVAPCQSGFKKTVQNPKTRTGYLLTQSHVPRARNQSKKTKGAAT